MPQRPKQRISSGFLTHSDDDYLEIPLEDRRGYCDPDEMCDWLDFTNADTQDEIDKFSREALRANR